MVKLSKDFKANLINTINGLREIIAKKKKLHENRTMTQ